jgi:S1-C subfamily serine protease
MHHKRFTLSLIFLLIPLVLACEPRVEIKTVFVTPEVPEVRSVAAIEPYVTSTVMSAPPLQPTPPTECGETSAYERVRPSVVLISGQLGSGTGFVVAPGQILTNAHVIAGERRLMATLADGRSVPLQPIRTDNVRDLALLSIPDSSLPTVSFGNESNVQRGARVLALGFPRSNIVGREITLTSGVVSAVRSLDGVNYVQTDTPINPGNSGGPLFTTCGEVIGVAVFVLRNAVGLNFAVAASEVKAFLPELTGTQPSVSLPPLPSPTVMGTATIAIRVPTSTATRESVVGQLPTASPSREIAQALATATIVRAPQITATVRPPTATPTIPRTLPTAVPLRTSTPLPTSTRLPSVPTQAALPNGTLSSGIGTSYVALRRELEPLGVTFVTTQTAPLQYVIGDARDSTMSLGVQGPLTNVESIIMTVNGPMSRLAQNVRMYAGPTIRLVAPTYIGWEEGFQTAQTTFLFTPREHGNLNFDWKVTGPNEVSLLITAK